MRTLIAAALICMCSVPCAVAQTPNPEFTHAVPMAVERGKTSEITVHTYPNQKKGYEGAFAVLFEGTGLAAEPLPKGEKESVDQLRLKVTVDPNAALGVREFRVAAASGISTVGQLLVVDSAVVIEQTEPHPTRDKAQALQVGQTLGGMLTAKEQVDVFKFTATAGQAVTVSLYSYRFFFKRHNQFDVLDPIVSLSDASGRELAANDDFQFADSLLHYKCEQAGDYYITVRDVDFNGTAAFSYVLQLTDRPFVTSIFPLTIAPTDPPKFKVDGFQLASADADLALNSFALPAPVGRHSIQLQSGGVGTNPASLEVTSHPVVAEVEPNEKPDQAQAVTLPAVINARMDAPNDVDHYALTLKAGQAIRCEVKARRLGSLLDSNLQLLNAQGGVVTANDDIHPSTKDSRIIFTAPADGVFTLKIRDLLYRGGSMFPYSLTVQLDEPDFTLQVDECRAGIGPGTAMPWYVRATRTGNFAGPIDVRVEGLPAGISVNTLTIPAHANDGVLILQAAADAKPVAGLVNVIGSAKLSLPDNQTKLIEHRAEPLTEMEMPGGGRMIWPVTTHAVSVCSKFDIAAVKVSPTEITLQPGQKAEVEVEVVRREGYTGPVTLDVLLQHLGSIFGNPLPPGVKLVDSGAKTSLASNETKGKIIIEAAADAKPFEKVPISINANVSISFVQKRPYASPPIWLTVLAPATAATK